MHGSNIGEWQKELRVLLDQIQANPSQDMTDTRERVIVLNKLIAAHTEKMPA